MFRKNKSKNTAKDDLLVLTVGVVFTLVLLFLSLLPAKIISDTFTDTRSERDFFSLTPFKDVELYYAEVSEDNQSIAVGGTMVKVRCVFDKLTAYITDSDGTKYRVLIDHNSPVKGNRPEIPENQAWGPWSVMANIVNVYGAELNPVLWEIYAHHHSCPSAPYMQTNLFASGPWMDYEAETITQP